MLSGGRTRRMDSQSMATVGQFDSRGLFESASCPMSMPAAQPAHRFVGSEVALLGIMPRIECHSLRIDGA